ncbi:MAG: AAA family ATPase [Candidatus Methylarchaceae archaeon HK02M1]|nr:AAA family ATPase [Candidatus Methylarchaceae archaeon HK02M1]
MMNVQSITEPKIWTRIEEIILENFMSYEYARIPLKSGLNVICGPNGAGKSTILIAISIVLGQAYTERSRKLSDLIRHGKDIARATLIFDNKPRNGRRPIPFCKSDTFMLSRYLRKDGSYWYEADYREIDKSRVIRLFRDFGMNPDNMLIIMHQNMVEEFSVISSQEKLKMVEEAVGFQEYRMRILEAERKLGGLIGEEESVLRALESAEQTLSYWKEIYEKSLLKAELIAKKNLLKREAIWAQVIRQEKIISSLKEKLKKKEDTLENIISRIEQTEDSVKKSYEKLTLQQLEQRKLYYSLLDLEKAITEIQVTEKILSQLGINPIERLAERIKSFEEDKQKIEDKISKTQIELGELEKESSSNLEKYVNNRVDEAILSFRKKNIEDSINHIKGEIREGEKKLHELSPLIEKVGSRIETDRYLSDIDADIKITDAHIQSLGNVPEEAEDVYNTYLKTYNELKERSEIVSENRKRTLVELEERKEVWRDVLQKLIDEVNPSYQSILSKIGAIGNVGLKGLEDIETAGLELTVGFRGANPSILNAYTQSGGERTVSIMAFLLSLQQHIMSPFRAVDEFDVHMDPRNRESIFKAIVSTIKEKKDIQYLMITPSQITVIEKDVHIIVVQNVRGESEAKVVNEFAQK